ncbi:MAG TPA: hypothetical protein VHX87_13465 [Galbitalea sp.]|nr:hypothetical protein [Galbitalea sp.]
MTVRFVHITFERLVDRIRGTKQLNFGERIASTNLNFLLGSGASRPLLGTLGQIETLLTIAEESGAADDLVARRFLQHEFFRSAIGPVLKILVPSKFLKDPTGGAYVRFFRALQALLHRRDSATEGRRARIFTTNYDPLTELALEAVGMDYEDGFAGRLSPKFSMGNYGSIRYVRSQYFETTNESPTVDVHKLHGSLTWALSDGPNSEITFDGSLNGVRRVGDALADNPVGRFKTLNGRAYRSILAACTKAAVKFDTAPFGSAYDELAIVNPSSAKYASTVLTRAYYDQLRSLSNELERTNTTLLCIGFSFEDLHIREIVVRAADSNPTLTVIVFAHDAPAAIRLEELLEPPDRRNLNVIVIEPDEVADAAGNLSSLPWTLLTLTERVLEPAISRRAQVAKR